MFFLLNAVIIFWSLRKYRKLSQTEKRQAKPSYDVTNMLNILGIVASLVSIAISNVIARPAYPTESPDLYEPAAVQVFAYSVLLFCIVAAVIGIYNIRKYSTKRRLTIF